MLPATEPPAAEEEEEEEDAAFEPEVEAAAEEVDG